MQREIKFRAWSSSRGEWVIPMTHMNFTTQIASLENSEGDVTIMQYTGLKDKNGREIYEGDILKYTRYGWKQLGHPKHNTDLVTTYEVFWDSEYCAFRVTNKNTTGSLLFDDSRATKNEIEIIGNIYENPDLLNCNATREVK